MSMLSERLSWQELFYGIALLSSKRSEDPHTKVGACLVKNNCVLGIGYNGAPRNFKGSFDWSTEEKYTYVVHAEMNCLMNASTIQANFVGGSLYLTLSPCHDCMKMIAQYQIAVVYFTNKYKDFDTTVKIARACGVKLIELIFDENCRLKEQRSWA